MGAPSPTPDRLPPRIAAALDDFVQRVRQHFAARVASLRLFGSHARGDYRADSDVDVLVVLDGLTGAERREVYDLAEEVYFDHQVHVSPLVHSPAEYAEIARREYRIAAEIARDGVAL